MSSKFSGPRIRFKTPAVCKKTPPPPLQTGQFTQTITIWFRAIGLTANFRPVNANLQTTCPLINNEPLWQRTITQPGQGNWTVALRFYTEPGNKVLSCSFAHELGGAWFGQALNYAPRSLEPVDTNLQTLTLLTGFGSGRARALS